MNDQASERQAFLDRILNSNASKKLIVAGPGTGKTYTFEQVLKQSAGNGLALTFIKLLADDLAERLGNLAHATTFHGYCKGLLHKTAAGGISQDFRYFPKLIVIQADDLTRLNDLPADRTEIERAFHQLDPEDGIIEAALRSGNYYDAVGHLDSVYRVVNHLSAHPEAIPAFDQIVVDEYQDFSLLEVQLIHTLGRASPLLIVGDDDQALYSFKHASSTFIRQLASDSSFERFELPFCTRCTTVLVAATHTVIQRAKAIGLLAGRIEKRYECYLPDKEDLSTEFPRITHANCSVDRPNAPYIGRYIAHRITKLVQVDSPVGKDADVLVIGPNPFLRRAFEYLTTTFQTVQYKVGAPLRMYPLDALELLLEDEESRLGWRVLLYIDPIPELDDILGRAIEDGQELVDLIPDSYRAKWLRILGILRRLLAGDDLSDGDRQNLEAAVEAELAHVLERCGTSQDDTLPPADEEPPKSPKIIVTNLVGSKGLQADHVFIIGMNEGHFPDVNAHPKESEVCELLVALTRAKKSCTLVSCNHSLGEGALRRSLFADWLKPHSESVYVDKKFFRDSTA